MLDSILHHPSANARSSAKRVDSVMILVLSVRVLVGASYMVAVASHRDAGDVGGCARGAHTTSRVPGGFRRWNPSGRRRTSPCFFKSRVSVHVSGQLGCPRTCNSRHMIRVLRQERAAGNTRRRQAETASASSSGADCVVEAMPGRQRCC